MMMRPRSKRDPAKLRRRCEPPSVEEAIFAAQGLTGDADEQVAIAARLIGLSEDEVRPTVLKARSSRSVVVRPTGLTSDASRSGAAPRSAGTRRAVVVETRGPRASLDRRTVK
jgi:hypothetical protein